jgi:hypothetical protein
MKKFLLICTAVAATACCCGKQAKVSAIVAGPDKVAAVVVEYAEALDAESVCPEAFVVEGREVVCAKLVEPTKVIVALKKECCCGGEKPECGEKKECCKEKAECGEKPACCEKKECGEKTACCEKKECGEEKPECCKEKPECCKEKCEIPVPEVAVQQVVDLKTAEGKVVKAWKKAVKATEAVPVPPCHKKPCCGEKPECDEKPDCCKKAE